VGGDFVNLYRSFDECLKIGDNYTHVENDGDYHVTRDGNTLKIFFEWSDGSADWRNNFKFFPIPWKPYKKMTRLWFCHRGFLKVWKSIEPYIKVEINDLEIDKIEIVGYSHGAAIALLCYEYCKYNRVDVDVRGVGFGSPRVFWGIVPKSIKRRFDNFTVVRNRADIVTHVPPALLGFRHISKIVKIGQSNPIKDHYPKNYLLNLKGDDIQ
jgi:hypothetical protein